MSNLNRRRDFDLIRKILLEIEDYPLNSFITKLPIDGYDPAVVLFHIDMLNDAGFIEANIAKTSQGLSRGPKSFMIKKIT